MSTSLEKENALRLLAKRRRSTRIDGYYCLHDFADGKYECDYVSPWSKSAHNVDASVMVIGQDWASEDRLRQADQAAIDARAKLGYDPAIPTNINLQRLLRTHLRLEFAEVYATNAFPFIKPGTMQGNIPAKRLYEVVQQFLLPQIEIVQPRVAICLGLATFNAVREASGSGKSRTLDEGVKSPFIFGLSTIVAVAHTGARGTNNRGRDLVEKDWDAIRELLSRLSNGQ